MEEFDPMLEAKRVEADDVVPSDEGLDDLAPSDEGVDVLSVPVAAAIADIEQDNAEEEEEEPSVGVEPAVVEEPVEEARVEEVVKAASPSEASPAAAEPVVESAPIVVTPLSDYFFSLEDRLPASLLELIYWRQPIKSGAVFCSLFVLLVSFSLFSVISLVAHLALLALSVTTSFVLFKKAVAHAKKTGEGHPFQELLDRDVKTVLPADDVKEHVQAVMDHLVHAASVLRGPFLVANLFDTLKLAVFLWGMTIVGGMFNLLTVFIMALVVIFAVPKTYEIYGAEMDKIAAKFVAQAKAQWPVLPEQVVERLTTIKETAVDVGSKFAAQWPSIQERVVERLTMFKDRVMAAVPIGKEKSS